MNDALGGAASGASQTKPRAKIFGFISRAIGALGGGGALLGAAGSAATARSEEKQNAATIAAQERMAREKREFEERMIKEDIQRKKDAIGKYKGFANGGDGNRIAKPKPIAAGLSARGGGDVIGRDPDARMESVGGAGGGGMNQMYAELLGNQRRR